MRRSRRSAIERRRKGIGLKREHTINVSPAVLESRPCAWDNAAMPPAPDGRTLSVMLCNYNHGEYLHRSVGAILSQSRPPDELVIVDDGSTDDSVSILEGYARDNPSVRLIRHPRNLGLNAAMDTGLAAVRSEYLYMAAADDYVKPGFFEKAMALAARHPEAGLVFGRLLVGSEGGFEEPGQDFPNWGEPTFASPERYLHEYLRRAPALHSLSMSTIYRRSCLLEVGGTQREVGYWVDAFTSRAIALKHGACFIPQYCAVFVFNPAGFCGSQVSDLERGMKPLRAAADLMRSPAFSDRFPAWYVAEWMRGAREDLIGLHCWVKHGLGAHEARRRRRLRFGKDRAAGRLMALVLTLPEMVVARVARWSARRRLLASTPPMADAIPEVPDAVSLR
jgi:glycosyltransferase involved in cell wall biosynthesis